MSDAPTAEEPIEPVPPSLAAEAAAEVDAPRCRHTGGRCYQGDGCYAAAECSRTLRPVTNAKACHSPCSLPPKARSGDLS
jgi:hypothetical protein